MNKALKISLIVGGSLVVAGAGFLIGKKILANRRNKRDEEEALLKAKEELASLQAGLNFQQTGLAESIDCSKKDRWIPQRDIKKDLSNPYSELKGIKLYVATKSSDPEKGHKYGLGYANVRNSAEVNNKTGTFDISNKIYKHTGSGYIGTVVSETYDNQNPKHRWFKVKLSKKREDCSGYTGGVFGCDDVYYGWVRGDNVTFTGKDTGWSEKCQIKSFCEGDGSITNASLKSVLSNEKNNNPRKFKQTCAGVGVDLKVKDIKNSFDGMTEVYDTSYQLGASVFPHSNWEEDYIGINGQEFECENGLTDL